MKIERPPHYSPPPRFFKCLLNRFTLYENNHSVEGDFAENFNRLTCERGLLRARLWYAGQVMRSLPEYVILLSSIGVGLFFNYIKLSFRNLRRYKVYSIINIAGLSIGLAAVVLILLYIRFEISYDRYHPDAERIYRIVDPEYTAIPYVLGERLRDTSPEIENMVRLKNVTFWGDVVVEAGAKQVLENRIFMAESTFFDVFSCRFISGNPASALSHPRAVVLTEGAAMRYFGSLDPLGKTVNIREVPFQVEAVVAEIPPNSHFHFNALVSSASETSLNPGSDDQSSWASANYKTYLKLMPQAEISEIEERATSMYRDGREDSPPLQLQALTDIHLRSHLRSELEPNGNIQTVRFSTAIGLIIMLVALLNFTNLAAAHSLHRCREVGLRKVLGAQKGQIVRQFVGEAMIFTLLAALTALGFIAFFLPQFRLLTGSELSWENFAVFEMSLFLLSIVILVGLAAGSYPAFFVSRLQPVKALRQEKLTATYRFPLRNLFVGVQFAITLAFVCSALFVWSQMHFIKKRQLSSKGDQIVNIELPRESRHHHLAIKTELLAFPGIKSASSSNFLPSTNDQNIGSTWEGRVGQVDAQLNKIAVDIDFVDTFEIPVIAGESFSFVHRAGATYMINETAARLIGDGIAGNALGKTLTMHTWTSLPGPIVGVVEDFHFRSLHMAIGPMVLFLDSSRTVMNPYGNEPYRVEPFRYVSARISPPNLSGALEHIQKLCATYVPYAPDCWSFYDADFDRLYVSEQRAARFMGTLAAAALLLSSMGLLGLSVYAVQNRRKEIGIRRVMGASTSAILILFFKDFLRIHLWAMLVAFPLIGFAVHSWLNNFAYRIALSPAIFAAGGLLTAALFFITSSLNVYKSAAANPADSLHSE